MLMLIILNQDCHALNNHDDGTKKYVEKLQVYLLCLISFMGYCDVLYKW